MKKIFVFLFLMLFSAASFAQFGHGGSVITLYSNAIVSVADTTGDTQAGVIYYVQDLGRYYQGDTNGYWYIIGSWNAYTPMLAKDMADSVKAIIADSVKSVSGAFSGNITGVKITASDSVKGIAGAFSGNITSGKITASDSVKGTAGAFSGNITGAKITASDSVKGTAGVFSENITGAKITASDSIKGMIGSFSTALNITKTPAIRRDKVFTLLAPSNTTISTSIWVGYNSLLYNEFEFTLAPGGITSGLWLHQMSKDSVFSVIDGNMNVRKGNFAVKDSVQVGSGLWLRKFFQSVTGDSVGLIYYNTVAARIDTVFMTQ